MCQHGDEKMYLLPVHGITQEETGTVIFHVTEALDKNRYIFRTAMVFISIQKYSLARLVQELNTVGLWKCEF